MPLPGGLGFGPMKAAQPAGEPFKLEAAIRPPQRLEPRTLHVRAEPQVSNVGIAGLHPLEPSHPDAHGQPRPLEEVAGMPERPPQTSHDCLAAHNPAEPRLLTRRLFCPALVPEPNAGETRPAMMDILRGLGKTVRHPALRVRPIDLVTMDDQKLLRQQLRTPWFTRMLTAWDRVPSAARMSAAAVSLSIVVLVALSFLPQDVQASWPSTFVTARQNIVRRAAVALTDDFRTGLSAWEGDEGWENGWSYDAAGFARVGPFAIYRPSLALSDYRMEFFGQIEKRGLGWAVRARDRNNYYAMKLIHAGQGPVPAVVFQRYPVIDGKAGPVAERKVNQQFQRDTLYQVQVKVAGSDFSLTIQGKIVDSWSESRLPSGGVGFFTGKGEQARLRWVGVWHQYDALGRLCALLAVHGR